MENLTTSDRNQLMSYLLSPQQYPITLFDFFPLCGYSDFGSALVTLERHFQIEKDFIEYLGDSVLAYPMYKMTIDCARYLASMALNEKGDQVKQFLVDMGEQLSELPKVYQLGLKASQAKIESLGKRLRHLEDEALIRESLAEIEEKEKVMWNELDQLVYSYATKQKIPMLKVYDMLFQIARESVCKQNEARVSG
ncbi:MAG TPA: hypothetical protein DCS93_17765 [Microscillaceae bacterium]|nr:hypothetical protein [Microscillaceae bacterium]